MPKADVDFHQFDYQTSFILYVNYIGYRIRKFKIEIVLNIHIEIQTLGLNFIQNPIKQFECNKVNKNVLVQ